jgi:hypothetical protein
VTVKQGIKRAIDLVRRNALIQGHAVKTGEADVSRVRITSGWNSGDNKRLTTSIAALNSDGFILFREDAVLKLFPLTLVIYRYWVAPMFGVLTLPILLVLN